MILDGTPKSADISDAEVMAVPVWTFHRGYYSALLSLDFGLVNDDEEKWMAYIQNVKCMLKRLEVRSKLAGKISFYLSLESSNS